MTETPGGPITEAIGSFEADSFLSVDKVHSPMPGIGDPAKEDAYTLQLNTNKFATSLCGDSLLCKGWQQFVLANNGTDAALYINYWLRTYSDCPTGWLRKQIENIDSCVKKSPQVTPVPNMKLNTGTMPGYKLIGSVRGTNDVVSFANGPTMWATSVARAITVGPDWKQAEFNVYGYADESKAIFNDGARFNARTQITHGDARKPNCVVNGYSNEWNNLSFVGPRPTTSGTAPALIFRQRQLPPGGSPAPNPCLSAVAVGDTHQSTFAGLLYDFQATGDFVEAQVGTAFEVQTRKGPVSAWPNTTVNRSVATRMGSTQIALCGGTNLVVDGRPTTVASGRSLTLPSGVLINRDGNVYVVSDQSGNSIQVTSHPTWTDLEVSLGTWPTKVRGLMGNPDNDPNWLEARDGTRLKAPVPFNQLYNVFGQSWRVASTVTLLQPCPAVTPGSPSGPFFTTNLPRRAYTDAQTICRQAQVTTPVWLDTCTLDVAVLGPQAAAVYVDRPPAVVDGNPPHDPPPCPPPGGGGPGCR